MTPLLRLHHAVTPPFSISAFFAAYQRLVGGWDVDFEDEVKEADGDRLCEDHCLQRRMVNVSVLSKDMVTPYR